MKKRLIPVLLGVIFIFSSFMTCTAFAASPASQDGLTATLTSSKTAYAANEDIDLSLTVANNNAYAVRNIQTAITLPDGATATGSLTQDAFSLAAGESSTNALTEIMLDIYTPQSPQTGDGSNVVLWLIIMLVSAAALVFIAIRSKKIKSSGILSLLLCFAISGIMALSVTANAAGTQKSFTVTKDITVDGKTVTVSAKISYDYVIHNTVTVTDGTGSDLYAEGDEVTITAKAPEVGYHFTGWTVVSGGITLTNDNNAETTFTMPDRAVEVKANYEINTYTLTTSTNSNGTISPQGSISVEYGEDKTFSFTANEGYHIKDVSVDDVSVGAVSNYTFEDVTADHTISVTFAADPLTLEVTTDWTKAGDESYIPDSYWLSLDGGTGIEATEASFTYTDITPGDHSLLIYNEAAGITINGTTATVNKLEDGTLNPMPGFLFSAHTDITLPQYDTQKYTAPMRQHIRTLVLTLKLNPGDDLRIAGITATLTGIASSIDLETGNINATEVNSIAPTFVLGTMSANGAVGDPMLTATLQMLGVMTGAKQYLSIAVVLTNGTVLTIVTDLTEALKYFGSGDAAPMELVATLQLPAEAGYSATISGWE